ncbi:MULTISPECIES: PP2C family protein-serine/threonine phosphatase [Rubritalea]|uniref:Serine/threonine phosphatase stp n=1 Tax=Rubritalea halochordaticola TaxID=714537 RepID=A0ABP9V1N8_9BACT|nr:protein phosphatase 2C domain-containing protein [Rubritalea squalenifaciens]
MNPNFLWSARTTSGRRKPKNDDSWLAFAAGAKGSCMLLEDGEHELNTHDLIFAVSDGMGGGNAGYLASSLILEHITKVIPQTFKAAAQGFHPDYLEILDQKVREIHSAINERADGDPNLKGMGATLTLGWFTPENLYIAHAGDSRMYLQRADDTSQLTEDHTFAWSKFNRGELNEREFRHHPRRSALFEVVGGGHQKIRPSVAAVPYAKGDRFMICSDGVIDGLWEKHIHSGLSRKESSTSEVADALMARAVDNAGSDDTTLIVIDVC